MAGKHALIIVDLQPDFLPGGPLGVNEGEQIIPLVLELIPRFDLVVATQDWHPRDHGSFAANHTGRSPGELIELDALTQILWPVHCVQDTPGAQLVPALREHQLAAVFRKGTDRSIDSYSGFFDNGKRKATGLGEWLREQGVTEVSVCGLALDYCVKFTALDALGLGFATTLIRDATRAVELAPGDGERAVAEIRAHGGKVVDSNAILGGSSGMTANHDTPSPKPGVEDFSEPELMAEGKWLRLLRRGRWEYAQRTVGGTAAIIVAVTNEGELILIEQVRPPIGGRTIELPAGLIGDIVGSEDEAPEIAAARELEEETGYASTRMELVASGTSSAGLSDERIVMFIAHGITKVGDGGGVEHEDIRVHLVPIPDVPGWLVIKQSEGLVVDLKVWSALYFVSR